MPKYDGYSLVCAWHHQGIMAITATAFDDKEAALSAFRAAIANEAVAAEVADPNDVTLVEYPRA